jgi:hypothetical protein
MGLLPIKPISAALLDAATRVKAGEVDALLAFA